MPEKRGQVAIVKNKKLQHCELKMNHGWLLLLLTAVVSANVWPLPSSYAFNDDTPICSVPFKFVQTSTPSDILSKAFTRYNSLIFGTGTNPRVSEPLACVGTLTVSVVDPSSPLSANTDESYTLSVSATNASMNAKTVFGALRGLETFSQLVSGDSAGGFKVTTGSITDAPRFPWRGLMIDTARHYLSVSTITKLLDAMVYSKLNVLHWHLVCRYLETSHLNNSNNFPPFPTVIRQSQPTRANFLQVDAESFPLVVPAWPNLSQAGAWNAKSVYTPDEISKIVAAAVERGIRVVPEVDIPGHAYSWYAFSSYSSRLSLC